jgi:hypothetical protein
MDLKRYLSVLGAVYLGISLGTSSTQASSEAQIEKPARKSTCFSIPADLSWLEEFDPRVTPLTHDRVNKLLLNFQTRTASKSANNDYGVSFKTANNKIYDFSMHYTNTSVEKIEEDRSVSYPPAPDIVNGNLFYKYLLRKPGSDTITLMLMIKDPPKQNLSPKTLPNETTISAPKKVSETIVDNSSPSPQHAQVANNFLPSPRAVSPPVEIIGSQIALSSPRISPNLSPISSPSSPRSSPEFTTLKKRSNSLLDKLKNRVNSPPKAAEDMTTLSNQERSPSNPTHKAMITQQSGKKEIVQVDLSQSPIFNKKQHEIKNPVEGNSPPK